MSEPRDQANRLRAMNELDTTFLVEAGAGTGKTRILVERFINCLRAGASLSEIVAITFTEKAAGDLRQRLTARLEELLGGRPEELDESAPLDAAERGALQQALDDIDTALVSTIHSFAGRLLRERPVEAGIDPAFSQLDELGSELMLTRLWRDWLEEGSDGLAAAGKEALGAALTAGVTLAEVQVVAAEHFARRHGLSPAARSPRFDPAAIVATLRAVAGPLRSACVSCLDGEDTLCGGMLRLADDLEGAGRGRRARGHRMGAGAHQAEAHQLRQQGRRQSEATGPAARTTRSSPGTTPSTPSPTARGSSPSTWRSSPPRPREASRRSPRGDSWTPASWTSTICWAALATCWPGALRRRRRRDVSGSTSRTSTATCWSTSSRTRTRCRWRSSSSWPPRTRTTTAGRPLVWPPASCSSSATRNSRSTASGTPTSPSSSASRSW